MIMVYSNTTIAYAHPQIWVWCEDDYAFPRASRYYFLAKTQMGRFASVWGRRYLIQSGNRIAVIDGQLS